MRIEWIVKHYSELTTNELYDTIALRTLVFVVEQDCPYQELDGKDKQGWHLMGVYNNQVIACLRVLPKNVAYPEISIGRVVTHPNYRGKGIGDELMVEGIKFIEKEFGKEIIKISAQEYLIKYYNKHGFKEQGDIYLEDDIPHIQMVRKP